MWIKRYFALPPPFHAWCGRGKDVDQTVSNGKYVCRGSPARWRSKCTFRFCITDFLTPFICRPTTSRECRQRAPATLTLLGGVWEVIKLLDYSLHKDSIHAYILPPDQDEKRTEGAEIQCALVPHPLLQLLPLGPLQARRSATASMTSHSGISPQPINQSRVTHETYPQHAGPIPRRLQPRWSCLKETCRGSSPLPYLHHQLGRQVPARRPPLDPHQGGRRAWQSHAGSGQAGEEGEADHQPGPVLPSVLVDHLLRWLCGTTPSPPRPWSTSATSTLPASSPTPPPTLDASTTASAPPASFASCTPPRRPAPPPTCADLPRTPLPHADDHDGS
jgi:hypothetical protein